MTAIRDSRRENEATTMRLIKGYADLDLKIKLLRDAAYCAAYTVLWNGAELSGAEKEETKALLAGLLINSDDADKMYSEIVQRVLMAKNYLLMNPGCYLPAPSEWFSASNSKGFYGTEEWYERLVQKRKSYPLHRLEYKAFGEAVLEMMEEPTARNFHYWRSWFIEHDCQGLLNLFLSAVANSCF